MLTVFLNFLLSLWHAREGGTLLRWYISTQLDSLFPSSLPPFLLPELSLGLGYLHMTPPLLVAIFSSSSPLSAAPHPFVRRTERRKETPAAPLYCLRSFPPTDGSESLNPGTYLCTVTCVLKQVCHCLTLGFFF